jgi:methionyl aminopeptidase
MVRLKTKRELVGIKNSCSLLAEAFAEMESRIVIGSTGLELNRWAEEFAKKNKAKPSFRVYAGFPTALCVSVNDAVIHGVPTDRTFVQGDLVGVDFGLELNGFYSDRAVTFGVGNLTERNKALLADTRASLYIGINAIHIGGRIQDIGKTISAYLKPKGYGIVSDYCGHGVGLSVHEDPQISHDYPSPGSSNPRIKVGMVLAIEPMVSLGSPEVLTDPSDGWTVRMKDHSLSAHFEHTIAVTDNGIEILTEGS